MPVFHGMASQNSWCSFKANFILIVQDIQFSPVYFATILYVINNNIFSTCSTSQISRLMPIKTKGRTYNFTGRL